MRYFWVSAFKTFIDAIFVVENTDKIPCIHEYAHCAQKEMFDTCVSEADILKSCQQEQTTLNNK